ncbi:MAG: D-glycerate dehydrogenase [Polyangiaceae bacterium]
MKVVVLRSLAGPAVAELATECDVVQFGDGFASPGFDAVASETVAILATGSDRIDGRALDRMPRLRLVANVAVGTDNVDTAACAARGVVVTNTPDVLTDATANLAFGLLLAAARRIVEGDRYVRAGNFRGFDANLLVGTPIHGRTLGIVGMGRIGRAMARRGRGFGMRIVYAQRNRLDPAIEEDLDASFLDVDTLFRESDFVSLHCPKTPDTVGLASEARLRSMKPGSIFVNTSRGACVDEPALIRVLHEGPLRAAGLDVFADEPNVPEELFAMDNVVLLPHVGSAETHTRAAMSALAVANVRAVLAGRTPLTPVTAGG